MMLAPQLIEKPWGRTSLPAGFPDAGGRRIGEIAHRTPGDGALPVLVKHIFTSEALSIQVHPDDQIARAHGHPAGKTEAWLILEAEPDATIAIGTTRSMTAAELRTAALDGSIAQHLVWHPVQAGDAFLIPAGTIHAIGAGISLLEVQQNSDVTYRLFDYGRPRALQLDEAVEAASPIPYPPHLHRRATGTDSLLADCPWFQLRALHGPLALSLSSGPLLLCPLAGRPQLSGEALLPGTVVEAEAGSLWLAPDDSLCLVEMPE